MHHVDGVLLSMVNEALDASNEADVKTADCLIGCFGFLIGPLDFADLMIIDGGSKKERVPLLIELTGNFFGGEFPRRLDGFRGRRRRKIR